MDYVMEIKITAAAKKIAEGSPILETALDFGFETHTGFTRTFLERIGCSPQDLTIDIAFTAKKGTKE